MLLTRLAFWYLPDLSFTRYLGGFGPTLDPSFWWRFLGLWALTGRKLGRETAFPVRGADAPCRPFPDRNRSDIRPKGHQGMPPSAGLERAPAPRPPVPKPGYPSSEGHRETGAARLRSLADRPAERQLVRFCTSGFVRISLCLRHDRWAERGDSVSEGRNPAARCDHSGR
jgi:hypothetical protein